MEEEEEMEVEEDRFVIVSHLPIECLPSEVLLPLTLAILSLFSFLKFYLFIFLKQVVARLGREPPKECLLSMHYHVIYYYSFITLFTAYSYHIHVFLYKTRLSFFQLWFGNYLIISSPLLLVMFSEHNE